jgi:hypothetical protein
MVKKTKTTKTKKTRRTDKTIPARFQPKFWKDADSRLAIVRQIRQWYEALAEQTGADSLQKEILCQRAVFLLCRMETVERRAIEDGEFPDVGTYVQSLNSLISLLRTLGLESAKKKVANLRSYIEEEASE